MFSNNDYSKMGILRIIPEYRYSAANNYYSAANNYYSGANNYYSAANNYYPAANNGVGE